MTALPLSFDRSGFSHTQIARRGLLAVYVRAKKGIRPHYEVIRIKEVKAGELFGTKVAAHEAYPGSEEWGTRGWTCATVGRALEKFEELAA